MDDDVCKKLVDSKTDSLAKFVVDAMLGNVDGESKDNVERTMLRCVRKIMSDNTSVIQQMDKIFNGYASFVTVANTLFEDEIVTWSRIIALYGFSGYLAVHCKESDDDKMKDLTHAIPEYLSTYAKQRLTPFILTSGDGWNEICHAFPE